MADRAKLAEQMAQLQGVDLDRPLTLRDLVAALNTLGEEWMGREVRDGGKVADFWYFGRVLLFELAHQVTKGGK